MLCNKPSSASHTNWSLATHQTNDNETKMSTRQLRKEWIPWFSWFQPRDLMTNQTLSQYSWRQWMSSQMHFDLAHGEFSGTRNIANFLAQSGATSPDQLNHTHYQRVLRCSWQLCLTRKRITTVSRRMCITTTLIKLRERQAVICVHNYLIERSNMREIKKPYITRGQQDMQQRWGGRKQRHQMQQYEDEEDHKEGH